MKPVLAAILASIGAAACGNGRGASTPCEEPCVSGTPGMTPEIKARLATLVLAKDAPLPADRSNALADDPRAAALGQKFFFDTRFSGPLLDAANDGTSGTLGKKGEAGKVACAGCHQPLNGAFADRRSPRGQLSLGSSWTHRKAPSLLNVAQMRFLMWDGRRDSSFSQVFSPLESPLEFNSSRLFLAQQVYRLYRTEYEALFGPMPALLDAFPVLAPADAGCAALPKDPVHEKCTKAGHDDDGVMRVVVNFGKAIQAFTRKLTCGRSRFDDWMDGDAKALTADEQGGAVLFVGKGTCSMCHTGPFLTDREFHNLGLGGEIVPFTGVSTIDDPGAAPALAELLQDPLNSKGRFSDGYDGRLDSLPGDLSTLTGSFHTPGLRCVSRRPSFMHNGKYRSLEDMVDSFSQGTSPSGFVGTSENYPRNFTNTERSQLIAFLRSLDGAGPDAELQTAPPLPAKK
jgi:cytochrome c peroxidase